PKKPAYNARCSMPLQRGALPYLINARPPKCAIAAKELGGRIGVWVKSFQSFGLPAEVLRRLRRRSRGRGPFVVRYVGLAFARRCSRCRADRPARIETSKRPVPS